MTRRTAAAWLFAFAAVYSIIVIPHWNLGHLDFGDGNYMYISWRVSQGAVLYRDVLAPQPPMHLYVGAGLAWIGRFFDQPLYAFRAFSLLLHLATMLAIYFAGVRIAGGNEHALRERCRGAGVLAAFTYLILPIGFWWSMGYQSEPLEMFFFVVSFTLFISWERKSALFAGILQALTPLTNMTAAPYTLFNMGYALVRRRHIFLPYAVPLLAVLIGVTILMERLTGAYLENVIFNQVGSFPRPEFLGGRTVLDYAFGKILNEGSDVLRLEGGYVLLALIGLLRYSRRGPGAHREYVSFYAFFALCSIIYVSKGGTMDYIFTIGEPFVAIFAGYFLFHFTRKHLAGTRRLGAGDLTPVASGLILLMGFTAISAVGLQHSYATLKQQAGDYQVYELPELETVRLVEQIRRNSKPDGLILAPPHYAFLAQRRIAEDYSELYLWSIKYHNERFDKVEARGVKTALRIAELLRAGKIDYVVLDMNQTGNIPEIREALEQSYTPQRKELFRSLNTPLQFYKPK